MAEISEKLLDKIENDAGSLISTEPGNHSLTIQKVATEILRSNVTLLRPDLVAELPIIFHAANEEIVTEEVLSVGGRLWCLINGVSLRTSDPNVAAVRAAICALPYPGEQDPHMVLAVLIAFSKSAGFSLESIFQAIASQFWPQQYPAMCPTTQSR